MGQEPGDASDAAQLRPGAPGIPVCNSEVQLHGAVPLYGRSQLLPRVPRVQLSKNSDGVGMELVVPWEGPVTWTPDVSRPACSSRDGRLGGNGCVARASRSED